MHRSTNKSTLILALGLVYILWGSTFLGMKIGAEVLPPFLLTTLRFILAGSLMLAIGFWKDREMPTPRQWLNAAIVGVLLIGIGNSTVALAVTVMPSGMVALFIAALPAWFITLDWAFFSKKKPKALTAWGLFLGFAGLFYIFDPFHLFTAGSAATRNIPLWPIPLLTLGSIAWSLGSLLSPRMDMPKQMTASGIQMLAGMVVCLIMSLSLELKDWDKFYEMTTRTWGAIVYLVLFGSLVGFTAYSWLVNNAPPQLTATYAYVNPVVAIFLGWLILDEKLSIQSFIGSAIVIAGVVLMTLKKK
ncbi:EamA family transporter [Chitinophaga lutea]|uniref:EamA family transporter n=1 Tax=Chitinophaga lutea TaxID=2488634 RepID=A0A3N4PK74_9BACT|nr:EamA family transporter [Chitinophaga lutea]RPE08215.1 EamA family transporter [Chitinophaga lutea]